MRGLMVLFSALLLALLAGCNHDNNSDDGDSAPTCPHCHGHSTGWQVPVSPSTGSGQAQDPTTAGEVIAPPADVSTPSTGSGQDDVEDDLNFEESKSSPHIEKAAVIVGINKYPGNALEGCVDDALDICQLHHAAVSDSIKLADVYVHGYGFKRRNIKLLLDGDATTANIRAALVWLAVKTHPAAGDARVFWYSGHGAEDAVSADANSEPDHLNQLMCPVDFDWSREHELIDKDLVAIFSQMPAGVLFNWGSDSCHSGDLDKGAVSKRVLHRREFPNPPAEVRARIAKVKAKQAFMHRNLINGILDVGFLSGCKSDQTSADSSDDHGRPCGAFTHAFIQALAVNQDATLQQLAGKMDAALAGYDQTPQAEGARSGKAWLGR